MKNPKNRVFMYQVDLTDKTGRRGVTLSEIKADCDENGRRKVIHSVMAHGGRVHTIERAQLHNPYPGEDAKQNYYD